jgi:guanylate kinase
MTELEQQNFYDKKIINEKIEDTKEEFLNILKEYGVL